MKSKEDAMDVWDDPDRQPPPEPKNKVCDVCSEEYEYFLEHCPCSLHVGDLVLWRGAWGSNPPEHAVIKSIETDCINKNCLYEVGQISWDKMKDAERTVIVSLNNGHWAYANQIERG
jgi:hypothetical protein